MCLLALSMAVKYTINDNRLKTNSNNNNNTNDNNNNNNMTAITTLTLNTAEMKITQKLKMQPQ